MSWIVLDTPHDRSTSALSQTDKEKLALRLQYLDDKADGLTDLSFTEYARELRPVYRDLANDNSEQPVDYFAAAKESFKATCLACFVGGVVFGMYLVGVYQGGAR